MESIGGKLKEAREGLGYSFEQIARETNITKSYLIALENEDFSSFPGETYLLGFLRNYAEHLGLDSGEMVSLYRNMVLQEQPAPIEELLNTRRSSSLIIRIIIIIAVVAGLAAVGYFFIYPEFIEGKGSSGEKIVKTEEKAEPAEVNIRNTYDFSDEVVEKRFRKGDAISVKMGEQQYQLVIAEIEQDVRFIYPLGELTMGSGDEQLLDLDGDSAPDIRILLRSLDSDNSSAVLHIDRFVQSTRTEQAGAARTGPEADSPTVAISPAGITGSDGRAGAPSRIIESVVIREASRPEAFNLNIVFRGYCLLRYQTDDSVREERYFHKGETFRLDVNSEVRLWASNAGALSGKVNGVDINLGGAGEVTARHIKWIYNTDRTTYELQLLPVY